MPSDMELFNMRLSVLLENNHGRRKLIRSNANQLKLRETTIKTTDESNVTPLSILIDVFGLQTFPPTNQLNPCQVVIQNMDVEVDEQVNPVAGNLVETHENLSTSFELNPRKASKAP